MNIRLLALSFFTFIIGFSACKKNNDAPGITIYSRLNVVNASADTFNFYQNGSRLNTASNILPTAATGYYKVAAGQQNFQVKKAINRANNTIQTLFTLPLMLDTAMGGHYSLFVTGETAAQAFLIADALMANDSTGTCLVRFVNASASAGNLDLVVGDKSFQNQAFKSASGFTLVPLGTGATPISVYLSGQSAPLVSANYQLATGRSYTFYSAGNLGAAGTAAFNLGAMINDF